jgi:YbbR domain-containing protein
MTRWFLDHLGAMLLAFVLALIVWVAAVLAEDPSRTEVYPNPLPIEYRGLKDNLIIVGDPPSSASITIRAPESVWAQFTDETIQAWIDLSDLDAGSHSLPVQKEIRIQPARISAFSPERIDLTLERASSVTKPVSVITLGEPAIGYRTSELTADPSRVTITGPESAVSQVAQVRAEVDVSGRIETLDQDVSLLAFDESGNSVEQVTIEPAQVQVVAAVEQLERYRLVSVLPAIEGQEALEAEGYLITSVSVTPTQIIVFSTNPEALEQLPGFIRTAPLDISTATGTIERRLSLELPEAVSLVGDQSVLVTVEVLPIESSLTLTREVQVQGLDPGLQADLSPAAVEILITGPQPTLTSLTETDVRAIVDLLDIGIGTFSVPVEVILAPTDVELRAVQPELIEVTVSFAIPASPTPTTTATPPSTP